jgi:hypothetical protein
MMNTPSMYSVDQLLKARQNGVPDYVVVPMLQKAMAQKQAMAQQQALQQGAPKPPVAQQILDAAHNDVMQEHMARQAEEKPEPRGIDSLPSGIDESDYAGGGIIAFAEGGDTPYQVDEADYAPAYTGADLDPNAQRDRYLSSIGTNPAIAKQEERISAREASLKGEEDKAPWLALMQAGLATMAGTSPNAFANIGEGASKGLSAYGESKKAIAGRMDKLDELRGRMEEAQRTEAVAAANFGFNSVEHKQAANEKRALEKQAAKLQAGIHGDATKLGYDKLNVEREGQRLTAGNAAEHNAILRAHYANADGAEGTNARDIRRNVMNLTNAFTNTKALLDAELAAEKPNKNKIGELKYKMGAINDKLSAINSIDTSGYVPEEEPVEEETWWENHRPEWTKSTPTPQPKPKAVKPAPIGKTSVSNW